MLGSGSGWEYDYRIKYLTVNGEGYSLDAGTQGSGDVWTALPVTASGGTSTSWISMEVLSQSQYHVKLDVDGPPTSDWVLSVHQGLCPVVYISMSQPWQCDANGDAYTGTSQDVREVGDELWYKYNYAFNVFFETQAVSFVARNVFGTLFNTGESGQCEGNLELSVFLQDTIFGPVKGEFMTATVIGMDNNLDELYASGAVFGIYPDIIYPPVHAALAISDRDYNDDYYSCEINIPFMLQNGLTEINYGLEFVPAQVWLSLDIVTEVLLQEPLEIGDFGGSQRGGSPPVLHTDYTGVIILVIIVIIAIVVIFMVFRARGNRGKH